MDYSEFFRIATGNLPYPYQCRLACGSGDSSPSTSPLGRGTHCESQLIEIPTGLGKTAGVVLAWLWNRVPEFHSEQRTEIPPWPRRLVFCLPMRTLVEQSRAQIRVWLGNLARAYPDHPALQDINLHAPVVLMGGEDLEPPTKDWDIHPERACVIIGTQDMLLSRALNRGYGMSRYRWPMHFGQLNNDCLWILDETQLMGVGLETTAQLAGLRASWGTLQPVFQWWMSATLDSTRLSTPEALPLPSRVALAPSETSLPAVQRRFRARKGLQRASTQFSGDSADYASAAAEEILAHHIPGTLSLVIVNTVDRAQEIRRALDMRTISIPITLLHSRFRPPERRDALDRAFTMSGDQIVVSTQVVEAGVDLSCRTLFTEIAPWSSLVQRFGRCHRHGEFGVDGGEIRWIDLPDERSGPYRPEELRASRSVLSSLVEASPDALAGVCPPPVPEPPKHILRPKDLRELYDTSADVSGADLDVSRFIREGDETDCLVFWRQGEPNEDSPPEFRDELCSVPIGQFDEFAKKHRQASVWTWDGLTAAWIHPKRFHPGRIYWVDAMLGGYDPTIGFDRRSKTPVVEVPAPSDSKRRPADSLGDDPGTSQSEPESLPDHTDRVRENSAFLATILQLPSPLCDALGEAAMWHDVGKAHPVFQSALRKVNPALSPGMLWAKSGSRGQLRFERSRFRHELASALAYRATVGSDTPHTHLVAFLVAAHHGKIRLTIRALPDEALPTGDEDRLFALGIWDGDELPALALRERNLPPIQLSLEAMQMGLSSTGRPSWMETTLQLRDSPQLGPFRLGYLEALLRSSDQRSSTT